MPRDCTKIKDITDRTSNWTAKIIVNEKSIPHQSRAGSKAYQNLVFSDSEGTRVRATMFDSDIDLLENTLTVLKSYYVSNISVRPSNPRYKFENTKYQWFINSQSIIEEVMKEDEDISSNIYNFTPLSDIHKHDSDAEIDIIAVVLDVLPPKKVKSETLPLQQIVLADLDLTTINLSMWNNFMAKEINALSTTLHTMPVILVTRIVGLNTRHSSTLIINPDIPIANTLHTWCSNHEAKLIELRKNMSQASTPTTSATTTTNIEDILNSKTLNLIHQIRASISVDNLQQKFWYMGCSGCKKKTTEKYNTQISCSCTYKETTAQPWFRVVANIYDSTGTISATLFGNEIKKLSSCTTVQMMHFSEQGQISEIKDIIDKFNRQEYIFQLKAYQYNSEVNFTVVSIDDVPNESQAVSIDDVPNESQAVSIDDVPNESQA